ncbi:Tetratricopeptide repeat-like superfamily protein [Heracleum sosnowskyi]|uniref:Tetratricopeptide repeat-like superfamily protein n=1 Tax=Heracleum sosnowskyi TaxID=360622 RepID=A0AAD8HYJ4_9APIA|nr:Tetratricopeptide repeat-like superfamily protein [Heracleum sosnowskyi]
MVTGKVIGLQRTSANPKPVAPRKQPSLPCTNSTKLPQKGPPSRSFGVYFPRASAQVQPRPPEVPELLHLLDEMRQRECVLETEILELKKFKDSSSVVSALEKRIIEKDNEIKRSETMVACLGNENERLRQEVEMLHCKLVEQSRDDGERIKALEGKVSELSRMTKVDIREKNGEVSKLQRFQGLTDISCKSKFRKNGNILEKFDYLEQPIGKAKVIESEIILPNRLGDGVDFVVSDVSRMPRIPRPPPIPNVTCSDSSDCVLSLVLDQPLLKVAPQPPPPPPPKGFMVGAGKVRRVPEVVEFYHSLMRRDSRRDTGGRGATDGIPVTANSRNMIGEIENRSAYLLAIKSDVETQGEFIRFLIKEVEDAKFSNIQDAVAFVKWLDDELSYLVDERAVLKHFQWPEKKADILREAVFGYCDVNKLVSEASSFRDDPKLPFNPALKKMQALFEKLEDGAYNLSRTRELAGQRYEGFQIPIDWMLETGFTSQIKLASVKLAMNYMKRVLAELEMVGGGSEEEELIVEGVRFAFRVHQFAGGFDAETMRAFQHLRNKARLCRI